MEERNKAACDDRNEHIQSNVLDNQSNEAYILVMNAAHLVEAARGVSHQQNEQCTWVDCTRFEEHDHDRPKRSLVIDIPHRHVYSPDAINDKERGEDTLDERTADEWCDPSGEWRWENLRSCQSTENLEVYGGKVAYILRFPKDDNETNARN